MIDKSTTTPGEMASDLLGMQNAIRQMVIAKKAMETPVEKGKKKVIKDALKK